MSLIDASGCPYDLKACGAFCIPSTDRCCSDGIGVCEQSQYCMPGGCCPTGEVCAGIQRFEVCTTFHYASNFSDFGVDFGRSGESYKTYYGDEFVSRTTALVARMTAVDDDDYRYHYEYEYDHDHGDSSIVVELDMPTGTDAFKHETSPVEMRDHDLEPKSSWYRYSIQILRLIFLLVAVPEN